MIAKTACPSASPLARERIGSETIGYQIFKKKEDGCLRAAFTP